MQRQDEALGDSKKQDAGKETNQSGAGLRGLHPHPGRPVARVQLLRRGGERHHRARPRRHRHLPRPVQLPRAGAGRGAGDGVRGAARARVPPPGLAAGGGGVAAAS